MSGNGTVTIINNVSQVINETSVNLNASLTNLQANIVLSDLSEVVEVMLLTACCFGALVYFVMGIVMSAAWGRWHFFAWLPVTMLIIGFCFTLLVVVAPGILFSILVWSSNIGEGGVELRLVIAMGLVQGILLTYFDLGRWRLA